MLQIDLIRISVEFGFQNVYRKHILYIKDGHSDSDNPNWFVDFCFETLSLEFSQLAPLKLDMMSGQWIWLENPRTPYTVTRLQPVNQKVAKP